MAGYQPKHVRLVVFLVLVCLAVELVRRVTLFPRFPFPSPPSTQRERPGLNADPPIPRLDLIHGRWETVRASLGLPPLTPAVVLPPEPDSAMPSRSAKRASRFDLGRKRRADEATRRLPPLHFATET